MRGSIGWKICPTDRVDLMIKVSLRENATRARPEISENPQIFAREAQFPPVFRRVRALATGLTPKPNGDGGGFWGEMIPRCEGYYRKPPPSPCHPSGHVGGDSGRRLPRSKPYNRRRESPPTAEHPRSGWRSNRGNGRNLPSHPLSLTIESGNYVIVHGDCPLRPQGDRHIFRPSKGRKMSQSPACERLQARVRSKPETS
jgi:hypothetical protein